MSSDRNAVRLASAGDAAAMANLVRLAFSSQSPATNPPPGAVNETATTIARHLALGGGAVV